MLAYHNQQQQRHVLLGDILGTEHNIPVGNECRNQSCCSQEDSTTFCVFLRIHRNNNSAIQLVITKNRCPHPSNLKLLKGV